MLAGLALRTRLIDVGIQSKWMKVNGLCSCEYLKSFPNLTPLQTTMGCVRAQ